MTESPNDDALNEALGRLLDDDAGAGASPAVEARLRDEVRALGAAGRRRRTRMMMLAAAVVLVVLPLAWWALAHRAADATESAAARPSPETVTRFYPLFYASVPTAHSHIVRMEVPRAALARFGLSSADAIDRESGIVIADVIVGDDGLARAVRFVQKTFQE